MTCYHPINVGVPRAAFGNHKLYFPVTVPCGNCIGCRADQARDWAIRITHEMQVHDDAWFITLTYNNEELPNHGSLDPEDLRIFFKTLRRQTGERISYYACGEYGPETKRPHYHAVLFGPSFLDRMHWRTDPNGPVWRSETLENAWRLGNSELTTVSPRSASYVAGYVREKVQAKHNPHHYERLDPATGEIVEVYPDFSRMSRRPPIGRRWIEKFWPEVYPRDQVIFNGRWLRPPRYYDKWMDQPHDPTKQLTPCTDCREHREILFQTKVARIEKSEDIEPDQLAAIEAHHRKRDELFSKRNKQ